MRDEDRFCENPDGKTYNLTVTVPFELALDLCKISEERGIPVSDLACQYMAKALTPAKKATKKK